MILLEKALKPGDEKDGRSFTILFLMCQDLVHQPNVGKTFTFIGGVKKSNFVGCSSFHTIVFFIQPLIPLTLG